MSNLTDSERMKYEKVWAHPGYGENSPGANVVCEAHPWFEELDAESVCDYGCGDGAAMRMWQSWGVQYVRGVDIVSLTPDAVQACLWEMGNEVPASDFAFSADVLEHIPTEKVPEVLTRIAERTRRGGFFQISTQPDNFGRKVGETLHLTVKPPEWWREVIAEYFEVIKTSRLTNPCQVWFRV